jgi:hypothetical protein
MLSSALRFTFINYTARCIFLAVPTVGNSISVYAYFIDFSFTFGVESFYMKKRSPISVKIEMPLWMRQFLINQSINKEEPIVFARRHELHYILNELISNDTRIVLPDRIPEDWAWVKIKLPFNPYKDVYFYNKLSDDSRKMLRTVIRTQFNFKYFRYVRHKLNQGMERKEATEMFLKEQNFSEDMMKYESLYRKFTRFQKNIAPFL